MNLRDLIQELQKDPEKSRETGLDVEYVGPGVFMVWESGPGSLSPIERRLTDDRSDDRTAESSDRR